MTDVVRTVSPVVDLARGITDSAFVLDRERNILEFNRPFFNLHQIDRRKMQQIKGSFCRHYVNMEICARDCIIMKCLESGATVRYDEVRGKTASGEDMNLIVTAVPVRNDAGEIASVLEIHRDVTDEAHIHEKYKVLLDKEKRAKEELEKQVAERTKELRQALLELQKAESQLVQSEKMSSLGQMVAGVAHELNNPINFIHGNIDMLREYASTLTASLAEIRTLLSPHPELVGRFDKLQEEKDLPFISEDLGKTIASVRKGSERAAEIIRGLRSFSRLDEAQLKEVNLHEDLDTTLVLLHHEYKDRIRVHKEYGPIPAVTCYSGQLNQVFMNLLHNAIQAVENEGDIWIRTRPEGDSVVIEIEDNGAGISPESLKKIFDPFFTTKPVGKGTGLGLSITYGIVQRHHGRIEVTSTVGKGTKFQVTIPQKLTEGTAPGTP